MLPHQKHDKGAIILSLIQPPPPLLPFQVRAVGLFCHRVAISRIVPARYGAFSDALKILKSHFYCLLGSARGTHGTPVAMTPPFFLCISFAHRSAGSSEIRRRLKKKPGCLFKVTLPR